MTKRPFWSLQMGMIATVIIPFVTLPAQALTLGEKTALQLMLIDHVEAHTLDGLYHFQDSVSGQKHRLYAANLHPKILDFGDVVVLCADFYDAEGNKVEVDFLTVPEGGQSTVEKTYIGQRDTVMSMLLAQYGKPSK